MMVSVRKLLLWAILMWGASATGNATHAQANGPAAKPLRLPCGAGFVQYRQPDLTPGFMRSAAPNRRSAGRLHPASFTAADVAAGQLKLEYIGHSSFLITSNQGVRVITDYNEFFRADVLPDIATMSSWHRNHSTDRIQPSIRHPLFGWDRGGGTPTYDVVMKDLRVYNIPTNIQGPVQTFHYSTSTFVIQSHGVCIAHMGLLAHVLDEETLTKIGRIDVVLVPIDGRVTQSFEEIVHNLKKINPRVVVPMHYFSDYTVAEFLQRSREFFPVKRLTSASFIVDKKNLPTKTEVHLMLPTQYGPTY